MGLSSNEASNQIAFLLTGVPVTKFGKTSVRLMLSPALRDESLDPIKLLNMTLSTSGGRSVPLSQIGKVEIREEEPILKRRDRMPTITVQCDIDDALQPPEVTTELEKSFQPVRDKLPAGYSINVGANTEESAKANAALGSYLSGDDRLACSS